MLLHVLNPRVLWTYLQTSDLLPACPDLVAHMEPSKNEPDTQPQVEELGEQVGSPRSSAEEPFEGPSVGMGEPTEEHSELREDKVEPPHNPVQIDSGPG